MEEIKEFKNLRYVLKQSGGQKAQIKDRMKRSAMVMRHVWELEKSMGEIGEGDYGCLIG